MRKRVKKRPGPLILAVQQCNPARVRALIATGEDVNASDEEGHTVLMHAAAKGRTGIVRLLLTHNADGSIEASYPIGFASAISLAAYGGYCNVIHIFLTRKSQPPCPEWNWPRKALRILNRNKKFPVRLHRHGQRYGADPPFLRFVALLHAAQGKHPAAVQMLRPYKDYGFHTHKIATNWFVNRVENNDIDGAKFWLDQGVEIDTPWTWGQRETALIVAAHNGNVAMVKLLLSRGADIHATTDYGYSVFNALEPPLDQIKRMHPYIYERLLALHPAYAEIRRLLEEHQAKLQGVEGET